MSHGYLTKVANRLANVLYLSVYVEYSAACSLFEAGLQLSMSLHLTFASLGMPFI